MEHLAEHYRFLALQLPIDQGAVGRGEAAETVDQMTAYVAAFLEEMQFDRAVLCGNSLGGQVALDFTLRHSERVMSLVLCGAPGCTNGV